MITAATSSSTARSQMISPTLLLSVSYANTSTV